jgi:hypothetical protein
MPGAGGITESNAAGTPLATGPSCNPGLVNFFGCGWFYQTYLSVDGPTNLSTAYTTAFYTDLPTYLPSILTSNNVITGMDLEPGANTSAFSILTQDASLPGFVPVLVSNIQPSALQTSAAAYGLAGKVVTAISYDSNGTMTYVAYGWQPDTNQYDVQTITATLDNGAAAAQTLADAGYIVTAVGGNLYKGVILVGTKVHGDTTPRPMLIIPGGSPPITLAQQGYATVGIFYTDPGVPVAWVGER